MATAKIVIETMAKNEGLQKLNTELATGCQNLKQAQTELRNLEKATKGGTTATAEQAERMKELNTEIIRQKQYNGQLSRAINETTAEIKKQVSATGEANGATGVWSKAMQTLGLNSQTLNTALGVLGGNILTGIVNQMKDLAVETLKIGANTQKFTATLQGMGLSAQDALTTYRQFNDVARDTNFNADNVYAIGQQMMLLGLNSKQAADMMRLCADAGVGLGKGQQGAEQIATAMAKIAATGRMGNRELDALKMSGINVAQILANKTGESIADIEKALAKGAINGQEAFAILAEYMQTKFAGAMARSKQNVIDTWGDLSGNMEAIMGVVGKSIFDAFYQSEIIQELVDLTQSFLTMLRSDGTGILSDFGEIGKWALGLIGDGLGFISTTIKAVVLVIHEMYDGFRKMCSDVIDWLTDLCKPLIEVYNWIKKIVTGIGKQIKEDIDKAWNKTFTNSRKDDAVTIPGGNKAAGDNFSGLIASYGNLEKSQKTAIINQKKFNESTKETIDWGKKLSDSFSGLANTLFNDSANFFSSFADMFSDFIQDICKQLLELYVKGMMVKGLGLFGGGGSSIISGADFGLGPIPAFAGGGIASGWAKVGENGPELIHVGSPSRVMTASESATMSGGCNVTVEIINQSGQQLQGKQGTPQYDAKGVVIPVLLEAIGENYMGINRFLKGPR